MSISCEINEIGVDRRAQPDIDMFNKLPDSLIVEILSRMPIIDACRTTILSKRWENMWTFIDNVVYWDSWHGPDMIRSLSFLDNALRLLVSSKIKKFHLCLYCYDEMDYVPKFDEWIRISVDKNVHDLKLILYGDFRPSYYLPQTLCSSSSLEKLVFSVFDDCSITIREDSVINWISLKSLEIKSVELTDELIAKILSGCPQLESLILDDFNGFNHLHLTSPKCRRLELNGHNYELCIDSDKDDCFLQIVAPYVEHLKISECLYNMEICLEDVPALVRAEVTFNCEAALRPNCQRLKDMVKHMLESICCANDLTISSWFLQVISLLGMEGYSLPLLECKQLRIESSITKYTFLGIGILLKAAPHLENLEIDHQ